MKRYEYPSKGDLVVVRIKRITNHGAFAELLEYPGKEAFIHISQIASSWVKNIRNHVSEGQVRVALVTFVDPRKRLIDASLRSIKPNQEKRKISEWKREKKADKLLELIGKKEGKNLDELYEIFGWKLVDEYGELYSALEEIAIEGEKALDGIEIPDKWKSILVDYAKHYVEPPKVSIKGILELSIPGKGGVDKINELLTPLVEDGFEVIYQGAPRYFVKIEGNDYKQLESKISKAISVLEKKVKRYGGILKFERLEE